MYETTPTLSSPLLQKNELSVETLELTHASSSGSSNFLPHTTQELIAGLKNQISTIQQLHDEDSAPFQKLKDKAFEEVTIAPDSNYSYLNGQFQFQSGYALEELIMLTYLDHQEQKKGNDKTPWNTLCDGFKFVGKLLSINLSVPVKCLCLPFILGYQGMKFLKKKYDQVQQQKALAQLTPEDRMKDTLESLKTALASLQVMESDQSISSLKEALITLKQGNGQGWVAMAEALEAGGGIATKLVQFLTKSVNSKPVASANALGLTTATLPETLQKYLQSLNAKEKLQTLLNTTDEIELLLQALDSHAPALNQATPAINSDTQISPAPESPLQVQVSSAQELQALVNTVRDLIQPIQLWSELRSHLTHQLKDWVTDASLFGAQVAMAGEVGEVIGQESFLACAAIPAIGVGSLLPLPFHMYKTYDAIHELNENIEKLAVCESFLNHPDYKHDIFAQHLVKFTQHSTSRLRPLAEAVIFANATIQLIFWITYISIILTHAQSGLNILSDITIQSAIPFASITVIFGLGILGLKQYQAWESRQVLRRAAGRDCEHDAAFQEKIQKNTQEVLSELLKYTQEQKGMTALDVSATPEGLNQCIAQIYQDCTAKTQSDLDSYQSLWNFFDHHPILSVMHTQTIAQAFRKSPSDQDRMTILQNAVHQCIQVHTQYEYFQEGIQINALMFIEALMSGLTSDDASFPASPATHDESGTSATPSGRTLDPHSSLPIRNRSRKEQTHAFIAQCLCDENAELMQKVKLQDKFTTLGINALVDEFLIAAGAKEGD